MESIKLGIVRAAHYHSFSWWLGQGTCLLLEPPMRLSRLLTDSSAHNWTVFYVTYIFDICRNFCVKCRTNWLLL